MVGTRSEYRPKTSKTEVSVQGPFSIFLRRPYGRRDCQVFLWEPAKKRGQDICMYIWSNNIADLTQTLSILDPILLKIAFVPTQNRLNGSCREFPRNKRSFQNIYKITFISIK